MSCTSRTRWPFSSHRKPLRGLRREEPGIDRNRKRAAFAVLSDPLLTVPPERLRAIGVDLTVVGGRVAFHPSTLRQAQGRPERSRGATR
jgi:hypothetical protein